MNIATAMSPICAGPPTRREHVANYRKCAQWITTLSADATGRPIPMNARQIPKALARAIMENVDETDFNPVSNMRA